jgi:hypothetical protein
MGEAKRRQSATKAFIEKHPDCFFCGGRRRSTTREHMPPKSLFDNSHRPDKLVMPACSKCNRGTSTADLTAAVISRWDYFVSPQSNHDHRRLVAQVRIQAPELIDEWTTISGSREREQAREHLRTYGVQVPGDAGVAAVGPLTITQLNLFAHKVSLALHFEHCQKPLPATGRVASYWRTKEDFAPRGIPSELLNLLPEYGTLTQGRWNESETFEYRHAVNIRDGLFGCLAKLRRGLFILGFTLIDPSVLPPDDETDWFAPADPCELVTVPGFQQRL